MSSCNFYLLNWDGCLQRKDWPLIDTDLDWDPSKPLVSWASDGRASSSRSRSENNELGWNLNVAPSLDSDLDALFVLDGSVMNMLPLSAVTSLTPTSIPDFPAAYIDPSQDPDQDRMWNSESTYPYPKLYDADVHNLLGMKMPQPYTAVPSTAPLCEEAKSNDPPELGRGRPAKKQKTQPTTCNDKSRRKNQLSKTKKKSHCMIEKRYRTNLNDKLAELQQTVPSLHDGPEGEQACGDTQKLQDKAPYIYQKGVIITHAIEYIEYLEGSTQRISSQVTSLKVQLAIFKKQLAQIGTTVLQHSAGPSQMPTLETLEAIQNNFSQIQAGKQIKTGTGMRREAQTQHATQCNSTMKLG